MDAPSSDTTCKAIDCTEPRVNDNFCGKHTHKLHPLYLRYKRLQEALVTAPDSLPDTVPELVQLYGRCAKIYELRRRYRSSLDPKHHDSGHGKAIDVVRAMMTRAEQKLRTLTSIVPDLKASASSNIIEDDVDDDSDTLIMAPEEIVNTQARYEMWDHRIDCISAMGETERRYMRKASDTIISMLRICIDQARCPDYEFSSTVLPRSRLRERQHLEWIAVIPIYLVNMATRAYMKKSTLVGNLDFYRKDTCTTSTYRRTIRALSMYPELYSITFASYAFLFGLAIKGEAHLLQHEFVPHEGSVHIRLVGAKSKEHVNKGGVAGFILKTYEFDRETHQVRIPVAALQPEIPSLRIACEACEKELQNKEPYKTRPNHVSEVPVEELQSLGEMILSGKVTGHLSPFRVYAASDSMTQDPRP